jgi:hypothetical protein
VNGEASGAAGFCPRPVCAAPVGPEAAKLTAAAIAARILSLVLRVTIGPPVSGRVVESRENDQAQVVTSTDATGE